MQTSTRHADFAANLALAYGEMLDGVRPALQRVSLRVIGEGRQSELELRNNQTGAVDYWRVSKLRIVPDQAVFDTLVLARQEGDPARLMIRDRESARAVLTACPRIATLGGARGAWPKIAGLGAGALASIAAILFLLIPAMADRGADLLSPEVEVALGDAGFERTLTSLGASDCKSPEGVAALQRMTDRLSLGLDLPYPLQVRVVDDPMVNAFAFAGGHVAIFRGLIDLAQTPDEVAAVLAHEIGHVAHRDATRSTLRMVGSFGIVGLVFGDVLGASGAAGLRASPDEPGGTGPRRAGAGLRSVAGRDRAGRPWRFAPPVHPSGASGPGRGGAGRRIGRARGGGRAFRAGLAGVAGDLRLVLAARRKKAR